MSKNVIIKGTLILTIAGFLTKLLGFYNRIFLTRVIGVKELGIYQLIFPVFMLAISFCCMGVSTALTKHVSYYIGRNEKEKSKSVFRIALLISLSFSILFMIGIYNLAGPISLYILKNTDCKALLKIISFTLPFVAVKSCINSYFIGDGNPKIQGISHFTEQLVRVVTAYILVYTYATNRDATLATISMVAGELFSGLLSIIIYITNTKSKRSSHSSSYDKTTLKPLLYDVIPITTNNLIFTLFSSLESIMLPAMLFKYYNNSDTSMELYGIVTGIVIPFLLFPATITTSLSTMLLPAISSAKARENYDKIKSAMFLCVGFCLILGFVTFIGYSLLGEWACRIAFKSTEAGVILRKMCFLCPFMYICSVLSSILNGLDKAFANMLINVSGLIVRILFVVIFVPKYGLGAYVIGMFAGYVSMLILMGINIRKSLINN